MIPCTLCGQENRRAKSGLCGTCYAAHWRKTKQSEESKKKHLAYVKRWNGDRSKRLPVEQRYRLSHGLTWPPEFKDLRRAVKRLEAVLASAEGHRGAGESDQCGGK